MAARKTNGPSSSPPPPPRPRRNCAPSWSNATRTISANSAVPPCSPTTLTKPVSRYSPPPEKTRPQRHRENPLQTVGRRLGPAAQAIQDEFGCIGLFTSVGGDRLRPTPLILIMKEGHQRTSPPAEAGEDAIDWIYWIYVFWVISAYRSFPFLFQQGHPL